MNYNEIVDLINGFSNNELNEVPLALKVCPFDTHDCEMLNILYNKLKNNKDNLDFDSLFKAVVLRVYMGMTGRCFSDMPEVKQFTQNMDDFIKQKILSFRYFVEQTYCHLEDRNGEWNKNVDRLKEYENKRNDARRN